MAETRTTCPYCGVGCGVVANRAGGKWILQGDLHHPANYGRLCSKGLRLADTLESGNRLTTPMIHGQPESWSRTIAYLGHRLRRVVDEHGPDAVAFYLSGQLLTEDYYVANKLMKGFIGGANIDTNSRLCMSSAVVAHKRGLGADTVPGCYEDFELADLVVVVGANPAWCHPVLFQRLLAARRQRPQMRLVVIDPRRSATAEQADRHLAIRPGGDLALFHGLANYLQQQGLQRGNASQLRGWAEAKVRWARYPLARVCRETGLTEAEVADFYQEFAKTERVVTAFSMGINQSVQGADQGSAILNCHLMTGRIGRPGMGPFSLTGQPNAMGGREVGGLASTLAVHRDFGDAEAHQAISEFWDTDVLARAPGLNAVEMFDAIAEGRIKAVWIMGTNPAVSLPDSGRIARALAGCPLVIVSDCVTGTDTQAFADVLLPAKGWGEKSGTVTNSERRLSRQRAFVSPPELARSDWWILCRVAEAMGYGRGFAFRDEAEIFREHAALSGINGALGGRFDLSALAGISDAQYRDLTPLQWPQPHGRPLSLAPSRLCSATPLGRPEGRLWVGTPRAEPTGPWRLNNGRYRDQWHTMTRTGLSPRLWRHRPWPEVAMHPQDAADLGVDDNMLVRLSSSLGELALPVALSEQQRRGELFAPMHWSGQFAGQAGINKVISRRRDPHSGQPGFKAAGVSACGVKVISWVQLRLPEAVPPMTEGVLFWSRQRGDGGELLLLATSMPVDECERRLINWLETLGLGLPSLSQGAPTGRRHLYLSGPRLRAGLFIDSERGRLPGDQLARSPDRPVTRHLDRLLMPQPVPQRLLCSCLRLTEGEIDAAIADGADSAEALAQACGAGSGCGSCRGEVMARCRTAKRRMRNGLQSDKVD